jgi:UTP--glucose-1-phosphate uridylyltransferase
MQYDANQPVLKQLIDLHEKTNGNIIGVQTVDKDLVHKYGIIDYTDRNSGKIKGIVEKPNIENAPSNMAGLGRYVVNSTIFDIIEHLEPSANGEYQLTDAMEILMAKEDFYACEFKGKYYDIGSKIGYMKANIDFALQRDDLKEELRDYLKKIV